MTHDQRYVGRCQGGPEDGKMMVHYEKVKRYYQPVVRLGSFGLSSANEEVIPMECGKYVYRHEHLWWWEEEKVI